MGKQVRDFLEPVAQCAEQDALDQVLDMLGAGNPVAVRWQGRWRLLLPEVVAGHPPSRRVIDLPLSEASLVTPELPAQDALTQLIDSHTPYALVTNDERLVGIVTQGRLLEYAAEVERTWTEVALQASEARLRTAFQNVPFEFWVRDRDGRCIFQNPASIRQWGSQVGKGFDEAGVDEETLAVWQRDNRRALAGEVVEDDVEYSHQGETRYLHSIVAPILVGGRVHGVLGLNIDITERKQVEEALRARTQQLEAIRVVTAEITRELDPTALLRLITQRAVELVGVASGTVWLWDEEAQMLVPKAWHGSPEWRGEVRLRLGEGVAGTVAQRREGLIVNDYRTSPYAFSFFVVRTDVTAVMGEPLMYRERLLGVLMINNIGTGRLFTEQDRETLALFASQAAIAIENARLYAAERERRRQLEAMRLVSSEIVRELDLTVLLRLIVKRATELLGVSAGSVRLWDEDSQTLIMRAWQGFGDWFKDVNLRRGEGIGGLVAERRQGMIVNDYRTSPYALPILLERTVITDTLAEPLLYHDRLLGVITLDNMATRPPFTEGDRELLALFASQAAIAIENARLHEVTLGHARQLAALNEVTRSLTMELDPQRVAQKILGAIRVLIPDTTGQLWEFDESSGTLHLVAMAPRELGTDLQREFQIKEGLAGLAVAKRQPVTSQDVTQDPRFVNRGWAVTERLVSCISLPLISRDRIQGALVILTHSPHRFTDEELGFLQSFSARAAIAIENARLFQSVSEQHAQLRNLTARLADVGEMQGQRLSRELHDCVGGNLTALNLNLSIVQGQLSAQSTANATARIEECMRLTEETAQHIRSVMTELRPPLLDDQGLVASLRWYADQFSARTSVASAVRGEEPRPRLPHSAEIALFRIAQEVLTNVAKHAQAREATLMLEETTEKARLTIADDGVGFDPATVRHSGERPWWGLITMRERAVAIGGSLRVESAPGRGTRVIVEVPR